MVESQPATTKKHLKARLHFAAGHIDKEKTCDLCGQKMLLFGHSEQQSIWRRNDEAFNPKNTIASVKHGAGSIMLWGCFFLPVDLLIYRK